MPTPITDLAAERSETLAHARRVVDAAKGLHRDLTDREQDQLTADLARVRELDGQLKGRAMVNSVMALGGPSGDPGLGTTSVFSDEAKAGFLHATKTRTTYRTEVDAKAALTTGSMLPTSGEGVSPGLHPGAFPLSSLFANEAANGPVVRYYRMGSGTAAVVAEGALKADAGISITPVDLTLEKLAATAQFSDEMSEDASFLVGYL